MDAQPVYTLFRGTESEKPMRLTVDRLAREIVLGEDGGSWDGGCTIIRMTPHRARAVGERLIAMADGMVKAESKS